MSAVVGSIAKIDENGLGMTDMEEPIWLWWEPSEDLPTCSREVLFPEMRVNLGVPSRFVKLAKETLLEDSSLC